MIFYDPQTKERKESGISGALVPASLEANTILKRLNNNGISKEELKKYVR